MSNANTFKDERDRFGMRPEDWKRLDALTDEEITAAALADPDTQPISPERLAEARPPSVAKRVRHKLRKSREAFCEAYAIPLATLTAWERHEAMPTPAELAYLHLIAREPELAKVQPARQPEPAK